MPHDEHDFPRAPTSRTGLFWLNRSAGSPTVVAPCLDALQRCGCQLGRWKHLNARLVLFCYDAAPHPGLVMCLVTPPPTSRASTQAVEFSKLCCARDHPGQDEFYPNHRRLRHRHDQERLSAPRRKPEAAHSRKSPKGQVPVFPISTRRLQENLHDIVLTRAG